MNNNNQTCKTGYTTGSCATAATAGALELLLNEKQMNTVELTLPDGSAVIIGIADSSLNGDTATASVIKDAGDDPDITHGALISSTVKLNDTGKVRFFAGEGVGTVTKEGLQLPAGEPAINPVPRKMMEETVREYTDYGVDITISVSGGKELAEKTFNPRLGIKGGISIIGTSGIVRPFSHEAIQKTVKACIDVACAGGKNRLVFVAGHYGFKAVQSIFRVDTDEIVEVSNEWDTALSYAKSQGIENVMLLSHPGKLAKFIDGHFNTHSSQSPSALPIVRRIANELSIKCSEESTTVEGIFNELQKDDSAKLANDLAFQVCSAAIMKSDIDNITVVLIDMKHNLLGSSGETQLWQKNA